MAKRRGLEAPGYGPDPGDAIPLDESGFMIKTPSKMSATEMIGKDKSMARFSKEAARQAAIKKALAKIKKTGQIPASPTR